MLSRIRTSLIVIRDKQPHHLIKMSWVTANYITIIGTRPTWYLVLITHWPKIGYDCYLLHETQLDVFIHFGLMEMICLQSILYLLYTIISILHNTHPFSIYLTVIAKPDVNIAYGSNVNYNSKVFIDVKGISINLDGSINTPITPEISGTLNRFLYIGTFVCSYLPLNIETWGTVAEIQG